MNKRRLKSKICSLSIALCMAINTFTFVEAAELSNIFKATAPENELENVSFASDETESVLSTEEMENLIESDTDYSELSEAEKEQISDEYLVNETVMEECETAGYSLSESVELAKIFQNTDLTPEQFEEMADNFGDRDVALQQAKKFANYRYTHSSFNMGSDTVCIGYLVSGIYAGDILKARAMAAFLEMDITEIADFEYTDDGSDDISYIADMFNTRKDVLEAYISNTEMSNDGFVEKAMGDLSGILEEIGEAPSTYALGGTKGLYDPENFPQAPFTYVKRGTEVINEQTGSVGYVETDATIKGKNGLDLVIGVKYDSGGAEKGYITADSLGTSSSIVRKNTSVAKDMCSPLSFFAPGWDFTFSYMKYYYHQFTDIYPAFVSSDGASRSIYRVDLANEDATELRLYDGDIKIYDVRLYKDSSYADNDVTSMFCAKYKNGNVEYFDEKGKLMKVENRYGDKIIYRYYSNGNEIDYFRQQHNKVEITDTLGQVTIIEKTALITEYDDSGNEIHIQPMVITLPDGNTITYRLRGSLHPNSANQTHDSTQVLDSKTNQEGMTTSFEYIEDDVSEFNFLQAFTTAGTHPFYPLIAVVHPTGLRTEYTYEHFFGQLGSIIESYERYRLIERKDIDGEVEHNKEIYSYTSDFTKTTKEDSTVSYENADGLIVEKTFSKYGSGIYGSYRLKTGERTYYMDGETEVNVTKTDYADYYERTYPQTVTKYVYNQDGTQYLSTTEKYEYDEFGDCIKYWDARANGDTTNTENLTTYAYDSEYHYLTESSYKTDTDTTIREVYTPTEDHKNILDQSVYMNDSPVSKTGFTYAENSACPITQTLYRSTTDGDSVTTAFEYLNNTFKTKETTNGNSINYTYDIYGNVLSQTDARGNTAYYEYDGLGRQTKVTYPDNTSEQAVYTLQNSSDGVINRVTATAKNGAVTEYNYDLLGNVSNVKDLTLGIINEVHEYDSMGRIKKITFPNNAYVTYSYDILSRTTQQNICEADGTVSYTEGYTYEDAYDTDTSKVTTTVGSGSEAVKSAQYTDKYGNVVREDLGDTGNLSESKRYTYDYKGNLVSEIFRTSETASDETRSTVTVVPISNEGLQTSTKDYYNHVAKVYTNMSGQERETIDGNGNHVYNSYDASGRLLTKSANLGSALSVTRYTYDANGNIVKESITDNKPGETETLRNTYMEYDSMNRLVRAWSDEESETRYTYDSLGNILTMTTGITESEPQGNTTTYEYDARGRLIKTTDPLGETEIRTYDVMGNLARVTDRNGTVTTNTYNASNKLISNKAVKGQITDTITYNYTTGGLVKSITDSKSGTAYTYNAKGQVANETTSGISIAVKNYTYDNDGNVSRVNISNGTTVYDMRYVYNPIGQMVTATDNIKSKTVASYEYDAAGNVSKETLANGVVTTYAYNELNALSSVTNKKGSTVISSYNYSYYLDGNRSEVSENNGRVQSFAYDKNGRLSQETDSINGQTVTTGYTYDRFGNRVSSTTTGAEQSSTTYTYDANNRLLSKLRNDSTSSVEAYYTYDDNGNLVSQMNASYTDDDGWGQSTSLSVYPTGTAEDTSGASVICYTYDLRNKLTGASTDNGLTASYAYDVMGNRVQKTVNGTSTRYVWNGSNIVYESGIQSVTYSYGMGLLAMTSGTDEYYYVSNGHGDITQLTNSSGTIAEDYAYDAFGNQKDAEHSIYNPFRYSGEYFDSETGFIYLRARYYDPSIGRFITEDPARDGLNWYVYCSNNPIMFVDPSGYLREPGSNRNGEWSDNPDRDDYGEGSKIYVALCRLTEAYEVFPEYHSAIADLANELRWIGNEWGSSIIDKEVAEILKIEQAKSLNTVEQVLVAAYKREAITVQVARVTSDMFTKMIYNEDGNGTNEANAFKHIYWSAYTTSEIGGTYTKLFLNAHEFGWYEQNLNNPEAMKMDLHNNQRGRYLGSLDSRKDLLSIVLNDIANGNAAILVNGKSVLNGR